MMLEDVLREARRVVQSAGYDRFAGAIREAIRPLATEGLGVRIVSEFGWIIGRVPGA
jgi:hypothetical protein